MESERSIVVAMKEFLKRVKADVILSALLCIALGIVIIAWPEQTIDIFCRVIAVGMGIMGVVYLVHYFTNRLIHPFSGILGLAVLLVGVWIFLKPGSLFSLIPIVIGVILAIHGIQDIKLAIEAKRNQYEKWWTMLIIALVSLIFGVVCIVNAFGIVKLATQLIGIALIYDGISDLWIVNRITRAVKAAKQEAEAVDVEYREVDDETE